jgi:hypothetical protein
MQVQMPSCPNSAPSTRLTNHDHGQMPLPTPNATYQGNGILEGKSAENPVSIGDKAPEASCPF